MTTTKTPVGIRAQGLTKRYGDKVAVDDLSFTAEPGVITGFLGPNGAGKSTTMRMLLGLVKPTRGTITIGGRHIAELDEPARTVGALLDARALHPRRTAFDHLLAMAQTAGLGRKRVGEVLDLVGLADAATRRAGEFSLGMHQRLGIAAALLGDPAVLVFDEPLNGLDPEGIRWARTLMRELATEGRTILFSSHLMSEMELTADNLVVVGRGRLVAESTLEDFVRANTTQAVTVSSPALDDLARALTRAGITFERTAVPSLLVTGAEPGMVGKIAAAEGIPLDELTRVRESLEDIFLRLTHDVIEYESHAA
ncbi:ABC transporter ATP-binding protein [Actinophytocola sp.]|jgi:ABC-2 type transport system ATP-binding protein|uniref:ABC transporter ATP-binding protein n=1 Tax=Actinophytocola sp. TaxID=1872138 RepID=UPI002D238BBC|nr:ATP-binding cassette domain-containing protein [Actinophytocola sp.]HYQ64304.1 ATP-binding cassette domain-containing protein [Actinophytocola sp.]